MGFERLQVRMPDERVLFGGWYTVSDGVYGRLYETPHNPWEHSQDCACDHKHLVFATAAIDRFSWAVTVCTDCLRITSSTHPIDQECDRVAGKPFWWVEEESIKSRLEGK